MSNATSLARNTSTSVSLNAATTPKVYNVAVPTANTEVSQALSVNTRRFSIKVRGIAKMQLAFTATESATTYVTVHPGAVYSEDNLDLGSTTLYFQTNRASQTIEIVEWT